jgi:signal transduction histidine kinase
MTHLAAAIDRLIAEGRAGGGPEIEFYDDVPIDELPSELQMVVFPVVQELLLNACRHSKGKNVLVGLARDDGRVCIQVQDWGVGFDLEMVQRHEHGLKAVRQLVQWRGGTVNVDSRPGAGTCIVVEIPLLQDM